MDQRKWSVRCALLGLVIAALVAGLSGSAQSSATAAGPNDPFAPLFEELQNKNRDWSARTSAARNIGYQLHVQPSAGRRIAPELILVLADTNESVHEAVVNDLLQIGRPAVEPLIAALNSPQPQLPEAAASVLGKLHDPRATEPLITALKISHAPMRAAPASALGENGDSRAIEPLDAALRDYDSSVWVAAIHALGKFGERGLDLLVVEMVNGQDNPRPVEETLCGMGTPAMERMIAMLHNPMDYSREVAAQTLGRCKDARGLDPLIAALQDDPDAAVRRNVATALAAMGEPKAADAMAGALDDGDALTAAWMKQDMVAIAGGYLYFLRRGEPGTEGELIDALHAAGDLMMRQSFVISGNETLVAAGRAWMPKASDEYWRPMLTQSEFLTAWGKIRQP